MSLMISLFACASNHHPPLETVESVDLNRYLGKWYEIARFEQRFQKGCTATTAEYSKNNDGTIKVVNRCRLNSPDGKLKEAIGKARVVDKETNAKLKVQFFLRWLPLNFLAGDYWIIELGDDYEYAMVGAPNREYLWFLARTATIDETLYMELVQKAENHGFDTSKLLVTEH